MTDISVTVEQLLAAFWLDSENQEYPPKPPLERLRQFAEERRYAISDADLQEAADHLSGKLAGGEADGWVVFICFWGHPRALWNFMIDAVAMADNDGHLEKIAACLAEHILAHYGSMIPHFEFWAKKDCTFKRMLTGVWRHRMSDDVWMRLRAIQAEVPDPLSNLIALEQGVEYMADTMSAEDRKNDDKTGCRYCRDSDGKWQKS